MLIYTLWHEGNEGDIPWCVDSVDEYTWDENGTPPSYAEHLKNPLVRELIIDVPEDAVRALFESPVVKAKVV